MVELPERFYWQIDGEYFASCNPKMKVKYRHIKNKYLMQIYINKNAYIFFSSGIYIISLIGFSIENTKII